MLMFIVGTIQRASGDIDRDAEYALSKLLQIGTVTEYQKEFEMLIKRVTIPESLLKSFFYLGLNWLYNVYSLGLILQLWEKPFFRARIIEARFEDENNQEVDANVGDQEEAKVKDKQEVKKADDQEIENIQDEKGKNVEDQQVSEADDDSNIVDFSLFYLSSSILGLIWTVKKYGQTPKTLDDAFSLSLAAEARFTDLQLLKFLRSYPSTLGEAFFRARITEARFEDENNQEVDANVGDQEEAKVKDKQEVKKADDQEIENIQDEKGKNVEDQQVSEADDDTNIDDFRKSIGLEMVLGPENDRASCGELDAQPSPPDEGVMTFLRKKVKTGAVVGKRVLLQVIMLNLKVGSSMGFERMGVLVLF
ncbi:hypothetical protein Tco_0422596 [Tanacetum coccineum]